MKKKMWIIYMLPIVFLILSIGLMTSGGLLKQPLGEDDRLLDTVQKLESNVKSKEWKQACNDINDAGKAWNKVLNRVQFSVEREYIYQINESLARIRGGIEGKDDQAIMGEIYFFYDLWENLGK